MDDIEEKAFDYVSANFIRWKESHQILGRKSDFERIKNDVQSMLRKGWSIERAAAWIEKLVQHYYRTPMPIYVRFTEDTTYEYKILYKMNGYSDMHDEISLALEKFPNDIDKAYDEMLRNKTTNS